MDGKLGCLGISLCLLIGAICIGIGVSATNLFLVLVGIILLAAFFIIGEVQGQGEKHMKKQYPYRPGIEFRLPNGRITTKGYAAKHPAEFPHWATGPNNVYGENIDWQDWEDWRINYFGE